MEALLNLILQFIWILDMVRCVATLISRKQIVRNNDQNVGNTIL